ncbi:MAG: hypothetical protein CL916_09040 [Deltaproteobacteria bacterium]|nr:hypothetical protein [Deltaproteobacteria bacterium]
MSKSKQSQSEVMTDNEQAPAQSSPTTGGTSNAEKQKSVREKLKEEGVSNYASALGSFLGPKLYEALHDIINEDELKGLALGAVESAVSSILEYAGDKTANPALQNEDLIKTAATQAGEQLEGIIENWLASPQGAKLIEAVQGWVGAHPYTIASVAILAAAAAVVTDMDIPALKTKFKLGKGLSTTLEAKLGSFQNIALEEVKAKLEYNKGNLRSAVQVKNTSKGTSGEVSGRFGTDKKNIGGKVHFDEKGLSAYELAGLYTFGKNTKINGALSSSNGSDLDNMRISLDTKHGTTKFNGGAKFNPTTGKLNLNYDQADDKGLKLGASLAANVKSGEADTFKAYLGHQESGQFDSIMGNYSYDFQQDRHDLSIQAQKQMGDFKLRGTQKFGHDQQNGLSSSSEVMGAYSLNDRIQVTGGAEYQHDQMGGRLIPKLGVQVDDMPITLSFDIEKKEARIGFNIKF